MKEKTQQKNNGYKADIIETRNESKARSQSLAKVKKLLLNCRQRKKQKVEKEGEEAIKNPCKSLQLALKIELVKKDF